ncbi:hypothetical protein BKK79_00905 [Cupriavidus sp. USMAA2-4]|nr:hypothetical protein BKK79_00905 [Cupriavidus sp. USMAA2-4]
MLYYLMEIFSNQEHVVTANNALQHRREAAIIVFGIVSVYADEIVQRTRARHAHTAFGEFQDSLFAFCIWTLPMRQVRCSVAFLEVLAMHRLPLRL